MAHYKKDAASNRDALFGGGGSGGGGSSSRRATAPRMVRPQQQQQQRPSASSSSSTRKSAAAAAITITSRPLPPPTSSLGYGASSDPSVTPGPSSVFNSSARTARNAPIGLLTGQAKISKMAEAEDYRLKAKKAMTRGIFSKPDPISAANFYKRAADAYKQCGENRLERLHRIASGDCQLGQDAYATAAAEYTRAAELAESTEDETLPRKRQECHKLHLDAANAWSQMGERGRAAESTMKAAFGLIMGEDCKQQMNDKALKSVEEAIESFLGDPLNRKRNYRRTGVSAYAAGPSSEPTQQSLELAKQNIITDSYAHETLFKAGTELIKRRHYESALYAHGAGTAALEHEGYATVSLSRAYVSEAILLLAMGDAVAASADFQKVHLQRTAYLSSRECALEEDLIRACDAMDWEALEEARARTGPHRAALANLDPSLRELVGEIRVSGRAKKEKKEVAPTKNAAPAVVAKKPSPPMKPAEEVMQDTDDGFAEMDDIMNQMGLNDDDDNDDDSDDDIDLT